MLRVSHYLEVGEGTYILRRQTLMALEKTWMTASAIASSNILHFDRLPVPEAISPVDQQRIMH
ncbi:MAG: hypothetical protein CL583_17925 [Alteromonadaceae bacterium]|nr:hypothetical protein [Alteromonadaceae bacterium]